MTAIRAKSEAEVIGFHLGWDINDVRECSYQDTRFRKPKVYTIGNDYVCAPLIGTKPAVDKQFPDRWVWEKVGTYYGREVYWSSLK